MNEVDLEPTEVHKKRRNDNSNGINNLFTIDTSSEHGVIGCEAHLLGSTGAISQT